MDLLETLTMVIQLKDSFISQTEAKCVNDEDRNWTSTSPKFQASDEPANRILIPLLCTSDAVAQPAVFEQDLTFSNR